MNGQDPGQKTTPLPAPAADDTAAVPRSGSGAGTALAAMLKKRQMRPSRDAESQVPGCAGKKMCGE
jgi:hypothetical protein